jgi:hypothetical protein
LVQDANDEVHADVNEQSALAGEDDDGIVEDLSDKVLAMAQDHTRMTFKYTTMQLIDRARPVTTAKVSRLRCNKMRSWNIAMREEKESISADLRRPKAKFGYKGRVVLTGEYAKEVANVYEEKREYYKEKVQDMKAVGRIGIMQSFKRAQTKRVKLWREMASLLIVKHEDVQY